MSRREDAPLAACPGDGDALGGVSYGSVLRDRQFGPLFLAHLLSLLRCPDADGAVGSRSGGTGRGWRWRPRCSLVDGWIALVAVASVVAVALVLLWLPPAPRSAPWHPPLWLLAGLFAATGSYVATIRIGRQAHVLQLDAVPKLIGLFFVSAAGLLGARLLGVAVALLLVRRQRGRKVLFNLASFALETSVAIGVFAALDPGGVGPRTWPAALSATLTADLVSAATVGVVIVLSEGRLPGLRVVLPSRLAVGSALGAGTVGLVAVSTLWESRSALALLAVLIALAAFGQRAFTRLEAERREQQRLHRLLAELSELVPGQASTSRALHAVRELLEVETVSWAQPGPVRCWFSVHTDDSSISVGVLDALERDCRASLSSPTGVVMAGGPVVHVQPQPGGRRRTPLGHIAVLLPATDTADHAAGDHIPPAGPPANLPAGETAKPRAAPRGVLKGVLPGVLVASAPLHSSRSNADLVRLTHTAAELLHQAVTRVEHRQLLLLAAREDAVTGVPTLPEFRRQMQPRLTGTAPLAVFLLNLQRLRQVNDVFGRATGDQVLWAAAQRAQDLLPEAVFGRVSGHHLVCAAPAVNRSATLRLARQLRSALERPLPAGGVQTEIGVRIGISLSPEHGRDVDVLLRRAESAADAADHDPFGVCVFDPTRERDSARPLRLVTDLRVALASTDQLQLHYQPQLDLRTGQVVSCEALLRWQHPELGAVSPEEFIELAESTGLISAVLDWTLEQALRQSALWDQQGLPARIAVNVSPVNLLDSALSRRVADALTSHRVPACHLILEITETSIMSQPLQARLLLDALRELGVGLSVDDFGTGYCNLSYLRDLPVHEVKLDRTFLPTPNDPAAPSVTGVGHKADPTIDPAVRSRAFLQHAIALVHALGLRVVVEGIEDQSTLELLTELGADTAQGFHLSRPLSAPACTTWLAHQQTQHRQQVVTDG